MSRQKKEKRATKIKNSVSPKGPACPICIGTRSKALGSDGPFYRCKQCGIVFNTAYTPLPYDRDYFLDDYRNQYGKTYEEDRGAIRLLADSRLKKIFSIFAEGFEREELGLLDLGSAIGFFMEAARDAGIGRVCGVELSSYASERSRNVYGLNVLNAAFEDVEFDETFDIITAWYFLEHCAHPREVMQRIYALLNPGGVFAFSVPSVFGPQFWFDREGWAAQHPMDHRIDFSPSAAGRILRRMGFRSVKVRVSGMHPERIVRRESLFYAPFSLLYGLIAPFLRFSDTIEVYAQK